MSNAHRVLAHLVAGAMLFAALPLATAQETAPSPAPETTRAPPQAQQEATDDAGERRRVEALREVSAERREEAVATARRAAEELDRQMERLQQQMDEGWGRMSEATRASSRETMADLRRRRNALAEWLGGMRHGSGAAWDEVRSGFVKSYREFADAMRKARAQFAREDATRTPEATKPDTGKPDTDQRKR